MVEDGAVLELTAHRLKVKKRPFLQGTSMSTVRGWAMSAGG